MTTDDLDSLLAQAARARPEPSSALLQKVLADGLALQQVPRPSVRAAPKRPARLSAWFGGGPVLAGLASAAILGVTFGYLNPVSYDYLTGSILDTSTEQVDLFPTSDFLTSEG